MINVIVTNAEIFRNFFNGFLIVFDKQQSAHGSQFKKVFKRLVPHSLHFAAVRGWLSN